jgi:hypothetical protein
MSDIEKYFLHLFLLILSLFDCFFQGRYEHS